MHNQRLLLPLLIACPILVAAALFALRKQTSSAKAAAAVIEAPLKKHSFGVDIGGTAMKLALVSSQHGFVVDSVVVNIDASKQPQDLIRQLLDNMTALLLKRNKIHFHDLQVMGVSCPGKITNRNIVSNVANLVNWDNVHLATLLEKEIGVPVYVFNDAKSALMAEVWSGNGMKSNNVCMLTLGTGVGGAVFADGRILQGHTGMFGEVGHHIISINPSSARESNTGVRGIAEEYCSVRALELTYQGDDERLLAGDILKQAAEGNALAIEAVKSVADCVAVLIINCCRMYDPEVVILGGGMSNSKLFVKEIEAAIPNRHWNLAPPSFIVKTASHANWAGAIGSVKLALMAQQED